MRTVVTLAVCATAWLVAQPARAQMWVGRDLPHTGSVEASGGALWSGGFGLGTSTAQLTRNPATGTGPYDLFTADTHAGTVTGVQGRVGVYLSRAVAVEAGVQYSRPVLSSRLSNDAEQASDTVAKETLARYVFDGSLVYHFGSIGNGKALPFVAVGGGYVRELHDGYGVVETGNEFHAKVGLKYWLTGGRHRLGLRADVGATSRSGGIDHGDARRTLPTAGVSLACLF